MTYQTRRTSLDQWQNQHVPTNSTVRELVHRASQEIRSDHALMVRLTRWNDHYQQNQEALLYWGGGMQRFEGWFTLSPASNEHTLSPRNNNNRPAPF